MMAIGARTVIGVRERLRLRMMTRNWKNTSVSGPTAARTASESCTIAMVPGMKDNGWLITGTEKEKRLTKKVKSCLMGNGATTSSKWRSKSWV